MGIDNLHTLERHVFAGSGAFNLSQIPDREIDLGLTEEIGYGAGQLSPSHVSVMSQEPVISGGTTEIARFLTNIDAKTLLSRRNLPDHDLTVGMIGRRASKVGADADGKEAIGARAVKHPSRWGGSGFARLAAVENNL